MLAQSNKTCMFAPRDRCQKVFNYWWLRKYFQILLIGLYDCLFWTNVNDCADIWMLPVLILSYDCPLRFFVDDVPIRRYPRKSDATFPLRPMYLYGSIWDASSWATEEGRYKADYKYQPFVGQYRNFKIAGCTADGPSGCHPPPASPSGSGVLSQQQVAAMQWVQRNYLVYNYCYDPKRDHTEIPEC